MRNRKTGTFQKVSLYLIAYWTFNHQIDWCFSLLYLFLHRSPLWPLEMMEYWMLRITWRSSALELFLFHIWTENDLIIFLARIGCSIISLIRFLINSRTIIGVNDEFRYKLNNFSKDYNLLINAICHLILTYVAFCSTNNFLKIYDQVIWLELPCFTIFLEL